MSGADSIASAMRKHIWESSQKVVCERKGFVDGHDWERAPKFGGRRCRRCGTTINGYGRRGASGT